MDHYPVTYGHNFKVRKCPGCGVEENRPEGVLCYDCQHLLELGKEVKISRSKGLGFYAVNYPHIFIHRFDGSQYSTPYVPVLDDWRIDQFYGRPPEYRIERTNISGMIQEVARAVNLDEVACHPDFKEKKQAGWLFPDRHPFHDSPKFVKLRHRTAWKISMLHEVVQGTIQDAYDTGYRDGSNVIRAMIDGRLSVEKMNSLSLGVDVQGGGHDEDQ